MKKTLNKSSKLQWNMNVLGKYKQQEKQSLIYYTWAPIYKFNLNGNTHWKDNDAKKHIKSKKEKIVTNTIGKHRKR